MLRKKARQPQSVFNTIMRPLRMLLIGQALLLVLVLLGSGVFTRLNQSYERSVEQQVRSRAGYLSASLAGWANLDRLTATINAAAEEMLASGELSLDTLDSQPGACAPLVDRIADELIATLYSKRISGVFLVFNTQDLSGFSDTEPIPAKTGVCLMNLPQTETRTFSGAAPPIPWSDPRTLPRLQTARPALCFRRTEAFPAVAFSWNPSGLFSARTESTIPVTTVTGAGPPWEAEMEARAASPTRCPWCWRTVGCTEFWAFSF